jgi:hypothetical protein
MAPGSLANVFEDRAPPLDKTLQMTSDIVGIGKGPFAAQIFGNGAQEYCVKYGATWEHVGAIGELSDARASSETSAHPHFLPICSCQEPPAQCCQPLQSVPQQDDDCRGHGRQEGH